MEISSAGSMYAVISNEPPESDTYFVVHLCVGSICERVQFEFTLSDEMSIHIMEQM